MSFLKKIAVTLFLELPVRGKAPAQLADQLEASGKTLSTRFKGASHTPKTHSVITHIIGIERWGQARVRVALGDPYRQEEYDGYRPAKETAWEELPRLFEETRAETVRLTRLLSDAQAQTPIAHNEFGDISARGWLGYLNMHANIESRKVR